MAEEKKHPLKEIAQPFVDLLHAPRALWGINLAYLIEGTIYFGMLNYLHMYFNTYVHLDDVWANRMVGVLTAGITFAMFVLGFVADKRGVRFAIVSAFILMLGGRTLLSLGPTIGLPSDGMGSALHLVAMSGIFLILIGYGMYQPAAYAAVRQFTTAKTASMGFAMLYAIMNLGIVLTAGFGWIRNAIEISGAYWVFVGLTVVALVLTVTILSRKTVDEAIARAKAARALEEQGKAEPAKAAAAPESDVTTAGGASAPKRIPVHLWISMFLALACVYFLRPPWNYYVWGVFGILLVVFLFCHVLFRTRWTGAVLGWLAIHPLANGKFFFFIFCLIPVQTLFAHNWLTLPMYVERAYREGWPWISKYFELALAVNPLLVFIFVPVVTALSYKRKVYNMMILGTFVMAAPTFLLVLGPSPWTLGAYILIMTLGESMWQPRFLQYAAEIAPEGRTGIYMGVAQLPWFMTKMIVPIYGGWFLLKYCPQEGVTNTGPMWFYYALIAMSSTVMLILAKPWVGKDFKTKAD